MSPPDPSDPLTDPEKQLYGFDAKRHPITGYPLFQGSGALSPNKQAEEHCHSIENEFGKAAADAMRRKCGLPVAMDMKAALAALEEKPILEAKIAELEAIIASLTADRTLQ